MTTDLRPKWLNFTRSLQKAACRNNGIAVVSSNVLVDNGGDPITWTEPDTKRLSPLSSQDDLIKLLATLASPDTLEPPKYLIAQVLDVSHLAINCGANEKVQLSDLFVFLVDNTRPYAILSVNEVRERISILQPIWVDRDTKDVPMIGKPIYKIYW